MSFAKGTSGNLAGRPKEARSQARAIRRILDPYCNELVERCLEKALSGDTNAVAACVTIYATAINPPPRRAPRGERQVQ